MLVQVQVGLASAPYLPFVQQCQAVRWSNVLVHSLMDLTCARPANQLANKQGISTPAVHQYNVWIRPLCCSGRVVARARLPKCGCMYPVRASCAAAAAAVP